MAAAVRATLASRDRTAARRGRLPAAVHLLLCLALAEATAAAMAQTVLGGLGATGVLAAGSGVMAAAALARLSPRRERGLALLLLASLVAALPLALAVGEADRTSPWSAIAFLFLGGDPAVARLLGLLLLCWASGAWVSWCALAEGAGAVACAVPLVALVADLVNVPPAAAGRPAGAVLAAVVSGLALMAWTQRCRRAWADHGGGTERMVAGGGGPALAMVAGCTLAITGLAVLLPPLNRVNFSGRYFHYGPAVADLAGAAQPRRSGFSSVVVPGGALVSDPTAVLSYQQRGGPQPAYLQGVVLSDFRAGDWYQARGRRQSLGPSRPLPLEAATASPDRLPLDSAQVRLTITYQPAGLDKLPYLLYPGSPLATPAEPGAYQVLGARRGGRFQLSSVQPDAGLAVLLPASLRITTVGEVSEASAAQLAAAGTAYPGWIKSYARLGGGDPKKLLPIARTARRMAAGATDPFQAALNIARALRAQETYTLDPPTPPRGTWPVDFFLTRSHLGYCQYFASAMGAMLRSLGIPARLVNGFAPQSPGSGSGPQLVRESDAHTWVEVYFPGYGWVTFDPTPGAVAASGAAGGKAASTPVVSLAVRPTQHPGLRAWPRSLGGGPRPPAPPAVAEVAAGVAGGVLLLLAVIAGLAGWYLRRPRHPAQLRRRLLLLAALAGEPHPHSLTLRELSGVCSGLLARPGDPGLEAALKKLSLGAERAAYAAKGATSADWASSWAPLRRRFPVLVWRAWRVRARAPLGLRPAHP